MEKIKYKVSQLAKDMGMAGKAKNGAPDKKYTTTTTLEGEELDMAYELITREHAVESFDSFLSQAKRMEVSEVTEAEIEETKKAKARAKAEAEAKKAEAAAKKAASDAEAAKPEADAGEKKPVKAVAKEKPEKRRRTCWSKGSGWAGPSSATRATSSGSAGATGRRRKSAAAFSRPAGASFSMKGISS